VVTELKGLYPFDVEIVKKTSFGLFQRVSMPKFPAIEIDGQVVFESCNITREQLEAAIKARQA
jgi:hypothetical protein